MKMFFTNELGRYILKQFYYVVVNKSSTAQLHNSLWENINNYALYIY